MFDVAITPKYQAPVTAHLPGEAKARQFIAWFKRFEQAEVEDISARAKAGELDDKQLCREVMAGWEGIRDPSGEPMTFDPANLETLLAVYPVPAGIVQAFYDSISGARLKN